METEIDAEMIDFLQTNKPEYYDEVIIDLSVARLNERYPIVGDFALVDEATGTATIRLNETRNRAIRIHRGRKIKTPFYQFFISNTAQAGRSVSLLIGRHASFEAETISILESGILNFVGERINPAREETFFNVQSTLLNAALTSPQSIILDLNGRTVVSFQAWADAVTTFNLDASFDGIVWRPFREYLNVTSATDGFMLGIRFIRLRSVAAGVAGNLVHLILQAGR